MTLLSPLYRREIATRRLRGLSRATGEAVELALQFMNPVGFRMRLQLGGLRQVFYPHVSILSSVK